ncbi:retention module-containing protein, partial [Halomonas sp. FL8]
MSTPIATVLSVTGQAWARDADGNLRPLEPGDVLLEGEELITGENGRVQLDFAEAEPVTIGPEQTVAMLADLDAQAPVPEDEAAILDEDLEALLTAIDEGEGDLLDVLDATAAGLGGGAGGENGGHSFVQLARISLSTDSPSYTYEPVALDETETALFVGEESLVAAEAAAETVDNLPPTLTITRENSGTVNGQDTSVVVFRFSEPVSGFDESDVTVTGGNLTGFTQVDSQTWSGIFVPETGFTGDATISIADNSYTDLAGNSGLGSSLIVDVDTEASATISIDPVTSDNTLNATEAGQTITVTGSVTGDAAA